MVADWSLFDSDRQEKITSFVLDVSFKNIFLQEKDKYQNEKNTFVKS